MGKGNTTGGEVDHGTNNGGSTTNNSTNPRQTENNRGTGGGNRGRKRGENEQKSTTENNQLPINDEPQKIKVEVPKEQPTPTPTDQTPKQGRGRPKGSTKQATTKKTSKQPSQVDPTQFILILQTMTAVVASRPGMEMFALTQKEAESIAIPLANILARNEGVGEVVGQYADHIALLIACATVMIPKVLMYQATQPKKQKKQKEVKQNERTSNPIDRDVPGERGNSVTDPENVFKPLSNSINDFLSPIV